ncbi:N-6 DNA methylase, partial [bacterium]|nr:N-6 DNA methylase [bacterium]
MTDDLAGAYSSIVSPEHRRALGQFFTPYSVAIFMCRWAMASGADELHDPAFGLGSFYFAAKALFASQKFTGKEIDADILDYFLTHAPEAPRLVLRQGDYLADWGKTHEAIVCNPPYMRFQHFANRCEVLASFERHLKMKLSGYTNIASAFLLKSLSELASGGRLAFIMPLEFLNTGYGKIVKDRLLQNGMLKALIKLEPEKEIFPDATTSLGIVLASKNALIEPVRFYAVQNLEELPNVLSSLPLREVDSTDLDPAEKWFKYFEDGRSSFSVSDCVSDCVSVDFYGRFSRGIATGANEFFTMSRSKRTQLGISRSYFLPCISKSAQIKTPVFTHSDFSELEDSDSKVFLLNVDGEPAEAVYDYLNAGKKMGYHLRYLTKMRTPWYKLERRTPAPLLFGVFSRGKYKVVRNLSSAINLTCYHSFYPNLFGQRLCDALFLYFQSRAARRILSTNMRRYGDGL